MQPYETKEPGLHCEQALQIAAFAVVEKLTPAVHGVHTASLVAAQVVLTYEPAEQLPQGLHKAALEVVENFPTGQFVQTLFELVVQAELTYCPEAHVAQVAQLPRFPPV